MTTAEFNRAVADATGETIHEVRHRGFSPLTPMGGGGFDDNDIDNEFIGRFLDWDDVDAHRNVALVEQRGSHALV